METLPRGFATEGEAEAARGVLARASYDEQGLARHLGLSDPLHLDDDALPELLARTAEPSPAHTLLRLFALDVPVEEAALRQALAPMGPDPWCAAGLVRLDGGVAEAGLRLQPAEGALFAMERRNRGRQALRADAVMAVAATSRQLARLTVRRPFRRALDLGTGAGFQALLAARHCDEVVAVDCNPRAVAFARLSAALSGVRHVQVREGDLFSPVAGESFDLIVSSPPFVVSPERRVWYMESGRAGDDLVAELLRQAPAHLVPGGVCQLLANWLHLEGQDPAARLRGFLAGSGCDALVLRGREIAAEDYPGLWVPQMQRGDLPEAREAEARWREHLRGLGVRAIVYGLITLRRRAAGEGWFRYEDAAPDLGSETIAAELGRVPWEGGSPSRG